MGGLAPIVVVIGGAIGAVLRYGLSTVITARQPRVVPIGTLTVNVIGAFLIGLLSTTISPLIFDFFRPDDATDWSRVLSLLLITGLCGGFTTFSTATLEAVSLGRAGRLGAAVSLTLVTLASSFAAVSLGVLVGNLLMQFLVPFD